MASRRRDDIQDCIVRGSYEKAQSLALLGIYETLSPEFDFENAWLSIAPVIAQYADALQHPDESILTPEQIGRRLGEHFDGISRRCDNASQG